MFQTIVLFPIPQTQALDAYSLVINYGWIWILAFYYVVGSCWNYYVDHWI